MPAATIQVRVPFADVDSSGRIHFTAWFRYMEVAEHALMRRLGLPYAAALTEVAFPRVHLEADFAGAIRYDDVLTVEARIAHVSARSWTVAFTAWPAAGPSGASPEAHPLASGRMTIVAMDPATEHATALPEALRRALLAS